MLIFSLLFTNHFLPTLSGPIFLHIFKILQKNVKTSLHICVKKMWTHFFCEQKLHQPISGHFSHFIPPEDQKTSEYLVFLGGVKWENWPGMS